MIDLSVIIPVYNSSFCIKESISRIIAILKGKSISYEIIICDDSSLDESWKELQSFVGTAEIRIYRNDVNRGLGFTLRRLISLAEGEQIIYCDMDLPFGAEGVEAVFRQMQSADIVVASRYMGQKANIPLFRKIFSRIYWFWVRILLNIRVQDIGSGTVGLKKSKVVPLNLESDGFDIHAELYVKAQRCGLVIKEIGLPSMKADHSSFSVLRHGPEIFKQTLRWWSRLKEKNF